MKIPNILKFSLTLSTILLLAIIVAAKSFNPPEPPKGPTRMAGHAGGLNGYYGISDLIITTEEGAKYNFGFGATSDYPGARVTSIGLMGAPAHIEGFWRKSNEPNTPTTDFYRIDAEINKELARDKISVMNDYYLNFPHYAAAMQVVVEDERVQIMYTLRCSKSKGDCTPKDNADPNGYVVKAPNGRTDVVVLFDGIGERSDTPYEDSFYYRSHQPEYRALFN